MESQPSQESENKSVPQNLLSNSSSLQNIQNTKVPFDREFKPQFVITSDFAQTHAQVLSSRRSDFERDSKPMTASEAVPESSEQVKPEVTK